ncbi:MAG: hypothetical protein F6K19_38200 [Cyanothece sp. SIO1E1]|nr:hypothetical protein [Cyanothece sp. SIO1E1]
MINALLLVIVYPFTIAFILGFITYNLGGNAPTCAKTEPETDSPGSSA